MLLLQMCMMMVFFLLFPLIFLAKGEEENEGREVGRVREDIFK